LGYSELIIRADAGPDIGAGHIMRCLVLAKAWRKNRGEVIFISHCNSDAMRARIASEVDFIPLESDLSFQDDLTRTIEIAEQHPLAWIAIDGYHFSTAFQKAVREAGHRLLVIDDFNHLKHYHATVLLNQNIGAENLEYSHDPETLPLLGSEYTLIRDEFAENRTAVEDIPAVAKKILVTMGGADPENATLKIVKALLEENMKGLKTAVAVGALNPHFQMLKEYIDKRHDTLKELQSDIQLVINADMPNLIKEADLAVTAGGSTCWELLYMGVPAVILTIAENQCNTGAGLERAGAGVNLGSIHDLSSKDIADAIKKICADQEKRKDLTFRGRKLIDGNGAHRILSVVDGLMAETGNMKKFLRKAEPEDSLQVLALSNRPDIRENSLNSNEISLETHSEWYQQKLISENTAFFVLDVAGFIGAQIRYEKTGDLATISFSIYPTFRGRGLGKHLIEWTAMDACRKLEVSKLRGIVKSDNAASVKIFKKMGFKKMREQSHNGSAWIVFDKNLQ